MKQMRKLGLAGIAAIALMALVGAGTASATAIYRGATKMGVGEKVDFSMATGGSGLFRETSSPNGKGETLDTCRETTVKMTIKQPGSSTTTTSGEITELTQSECIFITTTVRLGGGEIHHIAGTTNGTLTANAEIGVTISIPIFGSCVYGVKAGTTLGTLTGGNPATFDANSVMIRLAGSSFFCPETGVWTATYVNTEPSGDLHVEAS